MVKEAFLAIFNKNIEHGEAAVFGPYPRQDLDQIVYYLAFLHLVRGQLNKTRVEFFNRLIKNCHKVKKKKLETVQFENKRLLDSGLIYCRL